MRALTFSDFKINCPAKLDDDCKEECNVNKSLCACLYKEAIRPDLARQMREEEEKKKKK